MATPTTGIAAPAIERMATAARAFLEGLEDEQRKVANLPFDGGDGERTTWFYTPTDHGGLSLRDMDGPQQRLAYGLLHTGLSEAGYNTVCTIVGLENVLDGREGFRAQFVADEGRGRDPNFYYVTIFGEPGADSGWGWRFGGHHVSVNYTFAGDDVRFQPLFFGSNPAVYPVGRQLIRPLADEMDLGRALLMALLPDQRKVAIISPAAPEDMMTANRSRFAPGNRPPPQWQLMRGIPEEMHRPMEARIARFATSLGMTDELYEALALPNTPRGVAGRALAGSEAGNVLKDLADLFSLRLPAELREAAPITAEALADVHFAWAGSTEPGGPHYWRLHGPRLLIEYDCVQDGANHVHTVWRDPIADFGRDLLGEHLAASHVAH
jgi:hypothetical protein